MRKRRFLPILAFVAGGVCLAAAGAGGAWWLLRAQPGAESAAVAVQEKPEKVVLHDAKYVSLDKVIVMLRSRPGEPLSHYLAIDLVFRTAVKSEKTVREQLPLLRSIAVRFLSTYTMEQAGMISVDDLTTAINGAYAQSYAQDEAPMPFSDVMIGKLVIE
ncbi:flagellar basal body-associated FliL family protein [Ramlibacter sp. H39-3-26]|uniref:flagellar basal body-associated FliL family protein n=1 Tax=Curvibacter soli TaxID=3031331 RepID=UPI0023D9D24D|nr:flagellar basal body-associated FliL family protein [Ramlibacter sp. H39-3-26]MDF1484211.1 flagellar basal body-associated FliL family protein [Ramlibacter sp. H39-3-26]